MSNNVPWTYASDHHDRVLAAGFAAVYSDAQKRSQPRAWHRPVDLMLACGNLATWMYTLVVTSQALS